MKIKKHHAIACKTLFVQLISVLRKKVRHDTYNYEIILKALFICRKNKNKYTKRYSLCHFCYVQGVSEICKVVKKISSWEIFIQKQTVHWEIVQYYNVLNMSNLYDNVHSFMIVLLILFASNQSNITKLFLMLSQCFFVCKILAYNILIYKNGFRNNRKNIKSCAHPSNIHGYSYANNEAW